MKKNEKVLEKLRPLNRMDAREIYIYNNAKSLPNGAFGMCVVTVQENMLIISDADMTNIGEEMYRIPMDQIENLKYSSFPLNPYVKFEYRGMNFHLGKLSEEIMEELLKFAKKA